MVLRPEIEAICDGKFKREMFISSYFFKLYFKKFFPGARRVCGTIPKRK